MRLLENSTTRSVFNVINEELRDGKEVIVVKTGLSASDKKAKEILNSVIGQMSDGIWENSPGYSRYWKNIDIGEEDGEIVIYGGISYGSPFLDYRSSTGVKDDSAVRKFMAHKIKQIVKIEADDGNSDIVWKRDCETPLSYMGYDETITVRDCYRVYDKLLGRIDRITEGSIPSMHDKNFADYVLRDFRLFLMDRYDDELYRDVTEDDVNDYFTGMFFEMMDYDDLDSANAAEDIIRTEYHISDKSDDYQEYDDGDTDWAAEEEADALDRFENRYMGGGNGATFNESVRYATDIDWETDGDSKAKKELPKKVEIPQDVVEDDVADWLSDKYGWLVNSVSITEITNDRYQVREFDGPGAKFGVYDTKQKKFVQKGSKKVMIASCNDLNKKASLKESSNVIWKSDMTADDYDQDDLKANQYQDYLDSFDGTVKPIHYDEWLESDWLYNYLYNEFNDESNEYDEWYDFINNYNEKDLKMYYQDYLDDVKEMKPDEPKSFEDWFEDYMVDDSSNAWQTIEDDLKDNVIPMIDKQVNGAIFITGNYNSNYPDFKKSGPGGKIVKDGDDLVNWLSDEDSVEFTNEEGDQIGVYASDHDGSIGGLLFTLPDDPHKVLEIALSTDYYNENDYEDDNDIIDDFMYDLSNNNVSMKDIKKPELLVPIKNGFLINESVKPKKKAKKEKKHEERVIMKQGNVTCLKKDNKFKVFEDADTNLAEYDSQEEAMRDALNRCGVNPDNELSEEKDDLKESTQYQVIKTLNVGPSKYQSEVHGTYDSYEQAEDICNELNAQGIGATIKEVNEVDEALKKLLLKKEELYNDDTISDEDYYSQIEIIDNILINNYSVKDIEEAEKELGINS